MLGLIATSAVGQAADDLTILFWDVGLQRRGPGLFLRDALRPAPPPDLATVIAVLAQAKADVVVLDGVDYDAEGAALAGLAAALRRAGAPYPHHMALRPNRGVPTGMDADRDGAVGGPGDAQGWGRYPGAGGMAVLSRLPPDPLGFWDDSGLLWRDLPGNLMPTDDAPALRATQRLASGGFYGIPLVLPGGWRLTLLLWSATSPGFDGAEDRNGRRNHDEAAYWLRLFAGDLARKPPTAPFVLMGKANLDPDIGGGRPDALRALLSLPALQDPAPKSTQGALAPQGRDSRMDTAHFPRLGGLRVDYILPDAGLLVKDAQLLPQTGLPAPRRHVPILMRLSVPAR